MPKLACKPHSVPPNGGGGHLSGHVVANMLVQPTRTSDGTSSSVSPCGDSALFGLAPGGVCLASDITAAAGGLLHRRFTLTCRVAGNIPLCCTCRRVAPPGC